MLFEFLEKCRNQFDLLVVVDVGHQSQVGMKWFSLFVIQRIKEIDSILISLVRKVGIQSLLHKVLHLHSSHIGRIRFQKLNHVVLDGKFLGIFLQKNYVLPFQNLPFHQDLP